MVMTTLPNDIVTLPARWVHPNKKRYYRVFLSRDLLGDWVVTKSWGGISTSMGKVAHVACPSLEEAKKLIDTIASTRTKRGYILR
jgi:hypothetical protein